jgi:hypothetical protein
MRSHTTIREALRWGTMGALLSALTLVYGCGQRGPAGADAGGARGSSRNSAPHQLKKSDLTAAERKYGIAPVPDSSVIYQPDVILVGGGPEAIRSEDPNGLAWTIDANAPHAAELAPNKVFFMTGRAVGRVINVRKEGGNLVVIAGPVTLTDIIKHADIAIKGMPIDLNEAIANTATDLPGQQEVLAQMPNIPVAAPTGGLMPATYVAESGWRAYPVGGPAAGIPGAPEVPNIPDVPTVPDVPDVSNALVAKKFSLLPSVSTSGVGLHVSSDGDGMKVSALTNISLATPTLDVRLLIDDAKIKEASIELKGAAGLQWNFSAGTAVGLKGNIHAILEPDTDFSIPVGGIGPVPLAVTIRQRFLIKTGLGVRNSTLTASGAYTFTGSFKAGYYNGKWNADGPTGFTATTSMARTTSGISLGAEGLNLANQMKVIVGVGKFGFATGPYVTFTSAVGAFRGSDIGMISCSGATIKISLYGGVGYFLPRALSSAINSILHALNINAKVPNEGGLESDSMTLIEKTSAVGGCGLDTGKPVGTLNGPV